MELVSGLQESKRRTAKGKLMWDFVRMVLAKANMDDARKREIITLGLKVLAGQEVDV